MNHFGKLVLSLVVVSGIGSAGCANSSEEQEEDVGSSASAVSGCASITGKHTEAPTFPGASGGRTYWEVTNYCTHGVYVRIDVVSHQDPKCQWIYGGRTELFSLGIGHGDPGAGFSDRGAVDC